MATPLYYLIISAGTLSIYNGHLVFALMWTPGLAGVMTSLLFNKTLKGLGWRLPKAKFLLLAYFLPLFSGGIVYGLVWTTQLGLFSPEAFLKSMKTSSLLYGLLFMATVGVFWYSAMTALGEELGWRGFLAPYLVARFGYTKASLLSALLWSLYHYPILLFADYHSKAPLAYALFMFTLSIIAVSFITIWLRMRSQSVWPSVLLHASHNLFIAHVFELFTVDTPYTEFITTEFGAGLATVYAVAAYWCWKNNATITNSPKVH